MTGGGLVISPRDIKEPDMSTDRDREPRVLQHGGSLQKRDAFVAECDRLRLEIAKLRADLAAASRQGWR